MREPGEEAEDEEEEKEPGAEKVGTVIDGMGQRSACNQNVGWF